MAAIFFHLPTTMLGTIAIVRIVLESDFASSGHLNVVFYFCPHFWYTVLDLINFASLPGFSDFMSEIK